MAVDIKNRDFRPTKTTNFTVRFSNRLEFDPTLRYSDKVVNILTNPSDFQMKQIRDFESKCPAA
jgi:hypothetical protein